MCRVCFKPVLCLHMRPSLWKEKSCYFCSFPSSSRTGTLMRQRELVLNTETPYKETADMVSTVTFRGLTSAHCDRVLCFKLVPPSSQDQLFFTTTVDSSCSGSQVTTEAWFKAFSRVMCLTFWVTFDFHGSSSLKWT